MRPRTRYLLHAALIVEIALAVTLTIAWSYRTASIVLPSIGAFFAWAGFLAAHRLETGRLLDEPRPGSHQHDLRYAPLSAGILMMVVAFPVAILGVHLDAVHVIMVGELLFFSGFAISHAGLTGNLY